ncbi:MAG: hypothetical protein SCK70_10185 [bacterium]|nr:hypothetical protein [bacterium]
MKRLMMVLGMISLVFFITANSTQAKEPTLYVSTLATGHYHTGMAVPLSALFYRAVSADSGWEYMGRPNNRIFNFDFHRASQGKYIALATHTGVHQSFDYGKTWKVTTGWRITEVNNVAFDPDNPDILYCSSPYGFYKSIDAGKTWNKHIYGLNSINAQFVSSFIIDHSNPAVIYSATEDGVYKSVDAGASWEKLGLRIKGVRTIVQHPIDRLSFIVGTEDNGLYFTHDGGRVWERRETGILSSTFYSVAFDPTNADIIYTAGFQTGVYKSIDGGKKWSQSFHGLGILDIRTIAVDPSNSDRIFAGTIGKGLYKSVDGGQTWQYIGLEGGYISSIKIDNFEGAKK